MTRDEKIHDALNGNRPYQFYQPDPNEIETLQSVEKAAEEQLFNGPGGNEMIRRLCEVIKIFMEKE